MGSKDSVAGSVVALAGCIVSFTGRFDVMAIQHVMAIQQEEAARGPPRSLHRLAVDLRDLLRWAESLQRQKLRGRKKFTPQEQALLEDLVGGKLHDAANAATRKSGWGRIKHRDGTFEDIAPHNGGIVRTVLDKVDPASSSDEYYNMDEDSA